MAPPRKEKPNHYIVTVNDVELGDDKFKADDILRRMVEHRRWQLGERGAGRSSIKPGDQLVFYLAGKHRYCFAGVAEVGSAPDEIPEDSPIRFDGRPLPFMDLEFELADVTLWDTPVAVRPLLPKLSFVEERLIPYWGLYFRQATRRITKKDFAAILNAKGR
mgnify:CR=1 FL=1